MFTDKTKNEIEDKILSYCEGKTHVEFNINDINDMINDIESVVKNNAALGSVSQRSELLKLECKEVPFDDYLEKYFTAPTTELIYRKKFNGGQITEKEIIKVYKRAYKL